jgi:hypothetical protein
MAQRHCRIFSATCLAIILQEHCNR